MHIPHTPSKARTIKYEIALSPLILASLGGYLSFSFAHPIHPHTNKQYKVISFSAQSALCIFSAYPHIFYQDFFLFCLEKNAFDN